MDYQQVGQRVVRLGRGAVPVIAAVLQAACTNTMMPSTPVSVAVSIAPAPGTTGVPRDAAISISADVSMDSATCEGRMHLRLGDSSGPVVPMHLAFPDEHRRMMLRPDSLLEPMTTYWVQLDDSMMGAFGGMMAGSDMMGGSMMHAMLLQPPPGAIRTTAGIAWTFTTGP